MSFRCPICGNQTRVSETRSLPAGLRRRRRCVKLDCAGRMTTLELVVPTMQRSASMTFVPTDQLAKITEMLIKLTS
jgi:hypothetical protein